MSDHHIRRMHEQMPRNELLGVQQGFLLTKYQRIGKLANIDGFPTAFFIKPQTIYNHSPPGLSWHFR